MSIPTVLSNGLLPAGRHEATLDELHAVFVSQAPHSEARQLLFDALKAWIGAVKRTGLEGHLWLDGGFVTHKETAPSDVDLLMRAENDDVMRLSEEDQTAFFSLMTTKDENDTKIKAIGGQIDAYFSPVSRLPKSREFYELWTSVKGPDGEVVPNLKKGFLEVRI